MRIMASNSKLSFVWVILLVVMLLLATAMASRNPNFLGMFYSIAISVHRKGALAAEWVGSPNVYHREELDQSNASRKVSRVSTCCDLSYPLLFVMHSVSFCVCSVYIVGS